MAPPRTNRPDPGVSESELRDRLASGEIDLDTYVDRKIDAAIAHLRGLSASELRQVRELLRAQICEEPELRELVRRAARQRRPRRP
jgi:hypothetical protein